MTSRPSSGTLDSASTDGGLVVIDDVIAVAIAVGIAACIGYALWLLTGSPL